MKDYVIAIDQVGVAAIVRGGPFQIGKVRGDPGRPQQLDKVVSFRSVQMPQRDRIARLVQQNQVCIFAGCDISFVSQLQIPGRIDRGHFQCG